MANYETCSHSYKKLPLLSTEAYLDQHPEHAHLDEHDLMRERIEHEHADRVQLEEARQTLLKQKQTLIAENNKRKEVLAGLDKKLDDWMDASEVVEKEFGICEEQMGEVDAAAQKTKDDVVLIDAGA
jgi:THO complex subunit 5